MTEKNWSGSNVQRVAFSGMEAEHLEESVESMGVLITPERKLMIAILASALKVLEAGCAHPEWDETVAWFADDTEWIFGFAQVSAELNLSAEAIAEALILRGVLPDDYK